MAKQLLRRKTKKARKTRKQKGGFSPMIYSGVQNAGILFPLVMRQGYRLWNARKRVTRRRKH